MFQLDMRCVNLIRYRNGTRVTELPLPEANLEWDINNTVWKFEEAEVSTRCGGGRSGFVYQCLVADTEGSKCGDSIDFDEIPENCCVKFYPPRGSGKNMGHEISAEVFYSLLAANSDLLEREYVPLTDLARSHNYGLFKCIGHCIQGTAVGHSTQKVPAAVFETFKFAKTLEQHLKGRRLMNKTSLHPSELILLSNCIAEGLHRLHTAFNLLHLDLHTKNIVVGVDEYAHQLVGARIIDLGSSKEVCRSEGTDTHSVTYTATYPTLPHTTHTVTHKLSHSHTGMVQEVEWLKPLEYPFHAPEIHDKGARNFHTDVYSYVLVMLHCVLLGDISPTDNVSPGRLWRQVVKTGGENISEITFVCNDEVAMSVLGRAVSHSMEERKTVSLRDAHSAFSVLFGGDAASNASASTSASASAASGELGRGASASAASGASASASAASGAWCGAWRSASASAASADARRGDGSRLQWRQQQRSSGGNSRRSSGGNSRGRSGGNSGGNSRGSSGGNSRGSSGGNNSRGKCMNFEVTGKCLYGDTCRLSHG